MPPTVKVLRLGPQRRRRGRTGLPATRAGRGRDGVKPSLHTLLECVELELQCAHTLVHAHHAIVDSIQFRLEFTVDDIQFRLEFIVDDTQFRLELVVDAIQFRLESVVDAIQFPSPVRR